MNLESSLIPFFVMLSSTIISFIKLKSDQGAEGNFITSSSLNLFLLN